MRSTLEMEVHMNRILLFHATLGAVLIVGCAGTRSGELEPVARRTTEHQTVSSPDRTRIGFTMVGSSPVPVVSSKILKTSPTLLVPTSTKKKLRGRGSA